MSWMDTAGLAFDGATSGSLCDSFGTENESLAHAASRKSASLFTDAFGAGSAKTPSPFTSSPLSSVRPVRAASLGMQVGHRREIGQGSAQTPLSAMVSSIRRMHVESPNRGEEARGSRLTQQVYDTTGSCTYSDLTSDLLDDDATPTLSPHPGAKEEVTSSGWRVTVTTGSSLSECVLPSFHQSSLFKRRAMRNSRK